MQRTYKTIVPSNCFEDEMSNGGCCLCGRKLKNEREHMLHMMPDGTFVDDKDDPITEIEGCAELGYWGVGADCYKRFLKTAKEETKEEILSRK